MDKIRKRGLIAAIIIWLFAVVAIIAISGCSTAQTGSEIKFKADTALVKVHIHDELRANIIPKINIIDSVPIFIKPFSIIFDTTFIDTSSHSKMRIKGKYDVKSQKPEGALEFEAIHDKDTVFAVVTRTITKTNTIVADRPWYEYFVIVGIGVVFLGIGFLIGRLVK
jgi:hypothetical protein